MVVETDFDNHVQLLDKLLGTLSYVLLQRQPLNTSSTYSNGAVLVARDWVADACKAYVLVCSRPIRRTREIKLKFKKCHWF